MSKSKIDTGSLCKVKIDGLIYSSDGFAMIGNTLHEKKFKIYKEIRLSSYPSSNDFFGESTLISDGDVAIIVKYIGRPDRVKIDPDWFQYDVYEVFINGCVRQIFRHNLSEI
jgi:hypothetical protein